jgi:hypothetical protein
VEISKERLEIRDGSGVEEHVYSNGIMEIRD